MVQSSQIGINLVFSASVIASFAVNAVFLLLCEVCDFTASKWLSLDCLYFFYYLPTVVFYTASTGLYIKTGTNYRYSASDSDSAQKMYKSS